MSDIEKKVLRAVAPSERGDPADYIFFCPACKCCHGIWTTKENHLQARWTFNGNMDRPTFTPSLKITSTRPITDDEHRRIMAGEKLDIPQTVCHSVITDGVIEFCGDCTHALAGKKVPMEAF